MKTLIGVDFGESSLAAVRWVSRWFLPEAPLALAHGVWMPEGPNAGEGVAEEYETFVARAKEEGMSALAPLVQQYDPGRTEALVGTGTPAEALLALAEEWGAELIVVGPHGHSRLLTGFFGSTASRLLRASHVPVLVVRDADPGTPERILVALDESEATESVLHAARGVAVQHGCSITAYHAMDTPSSQEPEGGEGGPGASTEVETWLEAKVAGAGLDSGRATTKVDTNVGMGGPGRAICTAASDGTQLIVMGTRGASSGMSPLGSVARYVVAHAPCPVLVIPSGTS